MWDGRDKETNELFEKFSNVDVKWSDVWVAFLRLQRHLLYNFVDQLPVLNAHLLAPIYAHRVINQSINQSIKKSVPG